MRRTRILATLGPASDDPETIGALLDAGADAFRLNFSHGTHETHAASVPRIREAAAAARLDSRDPAGPERPEDPHRRLAAPIDLARRRRRSSSSAATSSAARPRRLQLRRALHVGPRRPAAAARRRPDRARGRRASRRGRLDDARRRRRTARLAQGHQRARRRAADVGADPQGHRRSARRHRDGRRYGRASASCRRPTTCVAARAAAAAPARPTCRSSRRSRSRRPSSVSTKFSSVADGLMVARGDLGIEMPLETLPAVQKRLDSRGPAPRRAGHRRDAGARVDARGAAADARRGDRRGARRGRGRRRDHARRRDGRRPVSGRRRSRRSIAIIREAESAPLERRQPTAPLDDRAIRSEHGRALCEAAVALAARAGAAAIVAVTEGGRTARMLAALRPRARILAATPNAATAARLALVWGVTPVVTAGSHARRRARRRCSTAAWCRQAPSWSSSRCTASSAAKARTSCTSRRL